MWTFPKRCGALALQRVFVLILFVAAVSFFFTYQVGLSIIYDDKEDTDGKVHNLYDRASSNTVDGGKIFGRSLNMHASSNERFEPMPTSLLAKLLQLEEQLLERTKLRKIGVTGMSDQSFFDILKRLRSELGSPGQTLEHVKVQSGNEEVVIQGNFSIILCVGDATTCPESIVSPTSGYQRMNRIVAIEKQLSDPKKLCEVTGIINQNTEKPNKSLDQSCHNLPEAEQELRKKARTTYPVIVAHGQDNAISVLYNSSVQPLLEREHGNFITTLHLFSTLLTYQAGPLMRLYSLVTSFRPLRFYMYPAVATGPIEALSQLHLLREKTTLGEILQYVGERYGIAASNVWWNTVQVLLLKTLVSVENRTDAFSPTKRYEGCFGVYSADLICVTVRRCFLLQFKPILTDMVNARKQFLKAPLRLFTVEKLVAMDVLNALEERRKFADFKICESEGQEDDCLSDAILRYLLDDRRESLVHTELIKVYPTATSSVFTPFLSTLSSSTENKEHRSTYSLHSILMSMEAFYSKIETSLPDNFDISDDTEMYGTDVDFDYQNSVTKSSSDDYHGGCSEDPTLYEELSNFETDPGIDFQQYSRDEYYAVVDYEVIITKIWANARHCNCEVRFEDVNEPARPTSFTLGLGENTITLLLVDISHTEPKQIRTLKLHVLRKTRGHSDILDKKGVLQTCFISQDCSLPYSPSIPCGLDDANITWSQFLEQQKSSCYNGDVRGAWKIPCLDCKSADHCFWKYAKWQPDTCSYQSLSDENIQMCLADKNILFLGDSTNRGIMHFLIEKINGSLYSVDKTHSLKVYQNLNKLKTNMTFAYYPHFWLPARHRPKFHKVLFQLIKRSLPLKNNSSTVLVVGGVHWLAKRHIDVILSALKRTGLSNITKVVKGLGAGFHQNLQGVRFVNKDNQAKLLTREREVLHYAKQFDFKVVATFNMTMARYKDFTQGKCACHFHKISKRKDNRDQRYEVEGDINAEYSQILLHNICNIT